MGRRNPRTAPPPTAQRQVGARGAVNFAEIPVVILCGGMGARLREETDALPKPLLKVGGIPILVHIMNHYSHFGFRKFVLCIGYCGFMIKEYFLNLAYHLSDFTLTLVDAKENVVEFHNWQPRGWQITFAETGLTTETGARIKRVEKYVSTPHFMATYGDGLSDVPLDTLYRHHVESGAVATMTGIQMRTRFGVIEADSGGLVRSFREKDKVTDTINGGFFAFSREIFDYLAADSVLEAEPFQRLVKDGRMRVFRHRGFWQCMDTYKELTLLNDMAAAGHTPWILKA